MTGGRTGAGGACCSLRRLMPERASELFYREGGDDEEVSERRGVSEPFRGLDLGKIGANGYTGGGGLGIEPSFHASIPNANQTAEFV